jgi:hypothetical protein
MKRGVVLPSTDQVYWAECSSLPNSRVEISTPDIMVLEIGALGRKLGHGDGPLPNGGSAFTKGTTESLLALFTL